MLIDVFNGDADGLCALLQWRAVYPAPEARLVSGVKRDNALLRRVVAAEGDQVLVLDITFDSNREALRALLDQGVSVTYFDHHAPGEVFAHPNLQLTINESPQVCTSLLVNQALAGQEAAWAVCGAFGDNLPAEATALAEAQGYAPAQIAALRQLGELLNYNGYGTALADLHFDPQHLYAALARHGSPWRFMAEAPEFQQLVAGHAADMAQTEALRPAQVTGPASVYCLPDAPWARRVIGVWANQLVQQDPRRAYLLLCPDGSGSQTASVRLGRALSGGPAGGAAAFCQRFPKGGGRASAGGINQLSPELAAQVSEQFLEVFAWLQ